jgi:ornithine carbamoyltransferase
VAAKLLEKSWPESPLWPADLLRAGDLTCVSLAALLDLAAAMKHEPTRWLHTMDGETLACFFDTPTTGISISAAAAAGRLGMLPVILPREELEAAGAESLADAARTVSSSAAALFVHGFAHATARDIAAAATVPVINARSDEHHPWQALVDLLTLRERFGTLDDLVVAFVGDGRDPAAHALMEAGALAGMEIRVASPPNRRPARLVEFGAESVAERHRARVRVTDNPRAAVARADAVYTAAWVPSGAEAERDERVRDLRPYRVDLELFKLAKPRAVLMHTLPARRGEEVAAQVIDGARSVVWEQVANRVPTAQAALYALVTAARAA